MKKMLAIVLFITLIISGCAGTTDTIRENKKTTIGAATGAVVGAGVGYALGKGKGAAIGAVVGGLAGGVIGQMMDRQEREFKAALAQSQAETAQANQRTQQAALESVRREQDAIIITFKSDVLFDTGSSALKPGAYSQTEIERVAQILNKYPDTKIRIEGHTDSTGSDQFNQQLSEQRANSVKNALISKNVDGSRIETIGLGESYPIADNSTEAGRQLNRRVSIIVKPVAQASTQ